MCKILVGGISRIIIGGLFHLLFFMFSCANNQKIINRPLEYSVQKNYNIPLESGGYNYSSMDLIKKNGKWYMYGFDSENYDLTILNISEERVEKNIKFSSEGTNALNAVRAMYVFSFDSIFFLNDINEVYLFNSFAERVNYWKIDAPIPKNYFLTWKPAYSDYALFAINKAEMLSMDFYYNLKNESIITNLMILPSYSFASDYQVQSELPILFEIQLNENKFIDYIPNFNPQNNNINLNMIYPFVSLSNGMQMVGMNYTSSIYTKELDTVFDIKSNNAINQVTSFKPTQEFDLGQDVKAYTQDEAYLGIYYDKYRKVYYRVFQHALLDISDKDELEQKIQAEWSLIVFKNNGEVIGEVNFPKEKYNFLELFVVPEGILLFEENPYDEQNKEDVLSFDLININYE